MDLHIVSFSILWICYSGSQGGAKNFINSRFITEPISEDLPPVVITRLEDENPTLNTTYRGQDFVWEVLPGWNGYIPYESFRWLAFREAPLLNKKVVLWARADLFPGDPQDPTELEPE